MDLTLNLEETEEGAEGWFEYATDLFKPETIKKFVTEYIRLLEQFCNDPGHQIQLSQTAADPARETATIVESRIQGESLAQAGLQSHQKRKRLENCSVKRSRNGQRNRRGIGPHLVGSSRDQVNWIG